MSQKTIQLSLDEEGDVEINKEALALSERLQHSAGSPMPDLKVTYEKNGLYHLPMLTDTNGIRVRGIESIRRYVTVWAKA